MDPLIDDLARRLDDLEFLVSGLQPTNNSSDPQQQQQQQHSQDSAQDAQDLLLLPPNTTIATQVAALRQETAAAIAPRIDTLAPLLEEIDALCLWKFLDLDPKPPNNNQQTHSTTTTDPSQDSPQDPVSLTIARESVLAASPSFAAVTRAATLSSSAPPLLPLTHVPSSATPLPLSQSPLAPISLPPNVAALATPAAAAAILTHAQTLRDLQAAVDALALESARILDQYAVLVIQENETVALTHSALTEMEHAKRRKMAAAAALAAASKQYSRRSLTSVDSSVLMSSD
ncbi:uncharacterized protein SAPINGB_P003555 [Magnusiomyces paraingens]|uniref:Uncharacterized protein n=1 Tax=Magnusiomyces paraingens TaxID=2606893 RepID=A0A5E8BQV0_9ASCO|nr:uncharacterized protein SAPINGB_P003555 [Saprochaete ingens]VVT53401.1 unnamed protein product [Saprochaete ingens]